MRSPKSDSPLSELLTGWRPRSFLRGNSGIYLTGCFFCMQIIEMSGHDNKSDIWSVGCLTIEFLTGSPPYFGMDPMAACFNIIQDPHPPLDEAFSSMLKVCCNFYLKSPFTEDAELFASLLFEKSGCASRSCGISFSSLA
jgi:serine/threonine protein kinase